MVTDDDERPCPYGHQSVWQETTTWLRYTLDKQRESGLREYGEELKPHHPGRDLWQDLIDEIVDAANYTTALRQAWYCLRDERDVALAKLGELEDQVADLESDLLALQKEHARCGAGKS